MGRTWLFDLLSSPPWAKFAEVVERSLETAFVLAAILIEAVTGLREPNAQYPNPWDNFSWRGPADLVLFTRHAPEISFRSVADAKTAGHV